MIAKYLSYILFFPIALFLFIAALISRFKYTQNKSKPRIVWGSAPILNNSYWAKAMKQQGFLSETFTFPFFTSISKRDDWDRVLSDQYPFVPYKMRVYFAFVESLFKYDIYVISYRGFFLQATPHKFMQGNLLKYARKKIIVIPYGSDCFVYKNIRSTSWMHALMISYPLASKNQNTILNDVNYWNKHADAVIPCIAGFDGIGRWDVLLPSPLMIDLNEWTPSKKKVRHDGKSGSVLVIHTPNHRGCKGTEFIINAVNELLDEGLKVELQLLEKIQNHEVRNILTHDADILVEQLIFTGHGLSGLEGMASGIPTISNLEDETYTLPMRRWSFLNECPLVSATPEDITDVLRELITNPSLRTDLGRAGREYVEKYHGLDSAQYLFENVFDYINGKKESIINLYHPILGEYPNRSPKIKHPLVNNRIVDKSR